MVKKKDDQFTCSFCGKTREKVKKLIAGPKVYICNECIDLCHSILEESEVRAVEKDSLELKKIVPDELNDDASINSLLINRLIDDDNITILPLILLRLSCLF